MKLFLICIVSIVLIAGCAASKKGIPEIAEPEAKSTAYDETFDPLSLEDDDIIISRRESRKEPEVKNGPVENTESNESPDELKEVDGYRVQIFATQSIEAATLTQQTASEQFGTLNHKTYLTFEAPFYKIRVGDLTSRSQANNIRDLAKEMGYDQSFPVKSKVMISKNNNFVD